MVGSINFYTADPISLLGGVCHVARLPEVAILWEPDEGRLRLHLIPLSRPRHNHAPGPISLQESVKINS
jgi:hypothetical protein